MDATTSGLKHLARCLADGFRIEEIVSSSGEILIYLHREDHETTVALGREDARVILEGACEPPQETPLIA